MQSGSWREGREWGRAVAGTVGAVHGRVQTGGTRTRVTMEQKEAECEIRTRGLTLTKGAL